MAMFAHSCPRVSSGTVLHGAPVVRLHTCHFASVQSRHSQRRSRAMHCTAVEEKTRDVAVMKPSSPVPYSDRDPYALPQEIGSIQQKLKSLGWNKEWVEQITDRIMKKQLRTNLQRTQDVVDFLLKLGLEQDEICNMAFICVPLLGLNPEKQLTPIVNYLRDRGVPADAIPDLLFKHPKVFEYRVTDDGQELSRPSTDFKARVRVDVVPTPDGKKLANVAYFRAGASFTDSPISPWRPPVA